MAVSLVQAVVNSSGSGANASTTLGSTPTAGSILVAVHGVAVASGTSSWTTPAAGWTLVDSANTNSGTNSINIYARVVQPGESSTYTIANGSSVTWMLHAYEISGASASVAGAIPAANHSNNVTVTTQTTLANTSITPTSGISAYLISGIFWQIGATSAQSIDGGLTATIAATNRAASAGLAIASTTGSYAPTWSWTTARQTAVALVLVQEGPSDTSGMFLVM